MEAPLKSEMQCYSCIFSKAFTPTLLQCRLFPDYNLKDPEDWCGQGIWRMFSKKFDCWLHFHYEEGVND